MGCLVTIMGAVALFFLVGGLGMILNPSRGDVIGEVSAGLFLVAISVLIIHFIQHIRKKAAKAKEDFYIFCGGKDNLKYEDYLGSTFGGYGIALDVNTKTIFLKIGPLQKAYPFTAIRKWESGVQNQTSYLTIYVKDVDDPEWKMTGISGKRWFEILNQEINES